MHFSDFLAFFEKIAGFETYAQRSPYRSVGRLELCWRAGRRAIGFVTGILHVFSPREHGKNSGRCTKVLSQWTFHE